MDALSTWWNRSDKKEIFIQILVFFLFFGFSYEISGQMMGLPMGVAGIYILYDCIKRKSLEGFYLPARYWVPLAVFLGSVVLASVLLGDKPSLRIAFDYVYWCLPFIVVIYLGKQADIKYAALLGVLLSLLYSSGNMVYLTYLYEQGDKAVRAAFRQSRTGAFFRYSNTHAVLIISVLPLLFCGLRDKILRRHKPFYVLLLAVALLSLWALWKTGSRGAMLGFCAGAFFTIAAVRFRPQMWKAVMAVLLAGSALISGYVFFGIIPGGTNAHGYDDAVRLRLVKHSYYLWQDHKLYGVGLANWATRYVERYRNEYKTRLKAWEQNTAGKQGTNKKVPKKAEIAKKYSIEMGKEFAISTVIRHKIPHNSIAWFFTTTGVIGGIGYMTFVVGYLCLFLQIIKKCPEEWIVLAGFWVFVAVGIHGLVDVGIAYKAAARLLYLMLGLALCYSCYQKQNELTEN